MNTMNMVPPIQPQQRLDRSADGDRVVVIPPGALSGTAAVIKNIKSMNMVPPTPAAAASPLFESDDVVTTTGQPDEEVAYPSPTPFDDRDHYDDNNLTKPRQLDQTFAQRTHDQDPQDRIEEPMPINDHDSFHDNDSNDNDDNERQSLCRDPSIKTSQESDFTKRCLPEDTFSFLIYSSGKSLILAICVFILQMFIYAVLAYDITSVSSNKKNPVKLPVNVEVSVKIAEALAIVVAIITQDEVRIAVNLIRDGFDEGLPKAFPGAAYWKWGSSIFVRIIEGLFGLFLTCLLIMQSATVLDLLLNFLAMEFVSKLDDVVFVLAREGFLGRDMQEEATIVSNTSYRKPKKSETALYVGWAYFIVLFIAFFAAYGKIAWNQDSGVYLCDPIFVQFGDEALPMLGTFSGLFHLEQRSFHRRLSYRDDHDGRALALLAYCQEEKRWTLSLSKDGVNPDEWNPCDWYAASSESQDFDVLTTANSQWVVKHPTKGVVPLSHHFMACHECRYNKKFCGESGSCKRINGEYKCVCEPGYYGLRCEYPEPCQRFEINQHGEGFVKAGRYFASKYYRLEGTETYNRPVYTSLGDNQTISDDTDFFVFTGVRWILSYKSLFPGLRDVNDTSELANYFRKFHGRFTEFEASFVSEPVYTYTQADAKASPSSVRWRFSVSDSRDQRLRPDLQKDSIETSFFCAYCDMDTNPCPQGAACLSGTCDGCPNDSSGTMCQIPSKFISNGQCDSQFNNSTFGFDGGDCCENTSSSTQENTCGKAGQGYIDTGYPSCVRASNQWELSGDPIHGESSASRSGHVVALSGKGKILAVADAGISIVRLFDKEGSKWIERSQVQGPPESNFGLAISLSDESYNISRNPRTYPAVTLAVGAPKVGLVRVFKCSTTGCIQRGEDIVGSGGFGFGNSLSISKDGNSIAIGGADRESIVPEKNTSVAIGGAGNATRDIVGDVKVFTWSKNKNEWQQKGNNTIDTPWSGQSVPPYQFGLRGYYVSLSGDYLAVGTLEGELTPVPRFESVNLITQVYKWDESTGWNQLGDEIKQKFYDDASFGDPWPLKPVVIKGHTLAIGSNSSVSVYEWNEALEWTTREIELLESSEVKGLLGWSVDLSEDANILAVGASLENPQPTDESIRMYQWDGKRYNALFNGVPGGPAAYVSLSSDGRAVAIGLPLDASKGGSTRVYSFHPPSPCYDPSEMPLRISFTTDGRPEETSWELQVDSQVKRRSGLLSGYMYTTFVEEMCIPETSCVKFIVYDTQGDGLNDPGVFALMLNGTEVARGDGKFGNETCVARGIGGCECT